MRFILESKDPQVVSANSALLALNKLNENQFDLLISDLGMAELDGYDLIRKVREKQHLNQDNLPAIALTGFVSTDEPERALMSGFQAYLAKPVELEQLQTIVLNLVKK